MSIVPTSPVPDEHASSGTAADLRVMLDAQREQCPVVHHEDGSVTLLGHAQVRAAALDADTYSSAVTMRRAIPNSLDGAEHRAFRALIDAYLTREAVDAQEPQCREHARQIVGALDRGAVVRTVLDIGTPFAVRAQSTWLGWPADIEGPLVAWMARNREASRTADREELAHVAAEFDALIGTLLAARRAPAADADLTPATPATATAADATPVDADAQTVPPAPTAPASPDVTTRLMSETVDGRPLTDAEIVSILRNWTAGDLGSLAASVGVIVHHLATDVALQSYLRALVDQDRAQDFEDAMEEILRIDDPFVSNRRVTTCPVHLGDREVPTGTRVVLNWTAANRDPLAFPDPDAFNPQAHGSNNLVFGIGAHVCPGRDLTLMELRVIIWELLAQTTSVRLARAPERERPPVSGWAKVPILIE